ncbi:MAG: DNA-processing protein DprA [Chitinophagaceae bacterium]|nr:DNA-processing protein DprA [Chitinophagaceae bacterium]
MYRFINHPSYQKRLPNCCDSPPLLFRGNADPHYLKIISIVGTRSNSDYGKHFAKAF